MHSLRLSRLCSAGDNTLNLLLAGPKKIVAVDLSPAQNAVLELKIAAIKNLTYDDYLLILGESEDVEKKRWKTETQRDREGAPNRVIS